MHKLTEQYRIDIKKYEDYKKKCEGLIRELLVQNNISFHKIESRIKDINKLDEKINRKNNKYKIIDDITDLIGIRIITYFEDEVDKVAETISKEFEIDELNSIDKRKLESDKFGYRSLHYVISLSTDRKSLTEYKRFNDIKVEIQVRSILQHAWAEIEHDLGYKNEFSIPDKFKRNFYRVAALLETADLEFVNIKNGLHNYVENLEKEIKSKPDEVGINSVSLKSFILTNPDVEYIDKQIVINSGSRITNLEFTEIENDVKRLLYLGIKTVKDLENIISEEKLNIIAFAKKWIKSADGYFEQGISIFYLAFVLVGKKNNEDLANQYYKDFIDEFEENKGIQIINTFKDINCI